MLDGFFQVILFCFCFLNWPIVISTREIIEIEIALRNFTKSSDAKYCIIVACLAESAG